MSPLFDADISETVRDRHVTMVLIRTYTRQKCHFE